MPDTSGSHGDAAALAPLVLRALPTPGLVVVAGPAGSGRSTTLRRVIDAYDGRTLAGTGFAALREVPGCVLSQAVRRSLPTHDLALLAEAVRVCVGDGLLVLDDMQWADAATLASLTAIAAHCRVVLATRTDHPRAGLIEPLLRAAARDWFTVTPRPGSTAPGLGGLDRPARTALAALGLLGRPASPALLGPGAPSLVAAGLAAETDFGLAPVSPSVAEMVSSLVPPEERRALHLRLAELVTSDGAPAVASDSAGVAELERARHLAAGGESQLALDAARAAAATATTPALRAAALVLGCDVASESVSTADRLDAAETALEVGRPWTALRVLDASVVRAPDLTVAVARAEACRRLGNAASAEEALARAPSVAPPQVRATALRIKLLCLLARDPASAITLAEACRAEWGDPPADAGLRAALAAVGAATRAPGWEPELAASAGAAGQAGDPASARWCAWLLVEALAIDGRVGAAQRAAARAAEACRSDLAYGWQTRFLAAELWCTALRGADPDGVARRATDLLDRTLPPDARALTTAAVALLEADSGLFATARGRLADPALALAPVGVAGILDWVGREAAWLDGQAPTTTARPDLVAGPLIGGLRRITAFWAGYDGQVAGLPEDDPEPIQQPAVVRETLDTWIAATASGPTSWARDAAIARRFERAARAWPEVARREQVRCLLARGLLDPDPATAVPPLLEAGRLAADAGLAVLLARVDEQLHRYGTTADGAENMRGLARELREGTGAELTDQERVVLALVARGLPARRIAGQMGLSCPAVEATIRAAAGRLGTHVRTVAAAWLFAEARG